MKVELLSVSMLCWIFTSFCLHAASGKKDINFRLEDPKVRKIIVHRYGSVEALPKDEKVVAPSDLAASPLLEEVAGLP